MELEKAFRGLPNGWRLRDQRLSTQFVLAGAVVGVFSVLSLAVLVSRLALQIDASRFLASTHRTISRLNTLGRDFYREQAALSEFAKARDPAHLAVVFERRQLWAEGMKALEELVPLGAPSRGALEGLQQKYQAWQSLTDEVLKRAQTGQGLVRQQGLEAALFKEAFLAIDRMIDFENRQLGSRDRKEEGAMRATFAAISVMIALLVVIFGIVLSRLYVSIAQPIADLSLAIARYRGGDFKARVEISSRSQIGYLEVSFNELAERIEAMVIDLRKLDELKSEFLSTVSHELRTPLTSIGGYAKLLMAGDAGKLEETQSEFLRIIDANVNRLSQLIDDLLDVEKMESGKAQVLMEPVDLVPVLKECHDTLSVLAAQKALEFRCRLPASLPSIRGDRRRLTQVFMNLLSNALKYTQRGFVELEASDTGFAIVVKVRDSGIGMGSDEKERIFQRFYRARTGLASHEGGTGLGLSIARGLIEAHGGKIHVETALNRGSTFTVTLPTGAASA